LSNDEVGRNCHFQGALQFKRLDEKMFDIDPDALFIVENSFNVIGSNFSKPKMY
jgi:uncharacterized membrane-anchored protein YitT (DUF2179 family)